MRIQWFILLIIFLCPVSCSQKVAGKTYVAQNYPVPVLSFLLQVEMDKYDLRQLNHTFEQGVSGQTSSWQNKDTNNSFQVIPQPTFLNPATKNPCRLAEITAIIGRMNKQTYSTRATACRDTTNYWHIYQYIYDDKLPSTQ